MVKFRRKMKKWLYGKCPGVRGAFPYYGTKVYFPENSHIFKMACDQGTYEHEIIILLLSLVKPETFFIDIGANIGLMSIPILYHIESCHVLSFEPSPNALPFLRHTVEESRFVNRWKVVGKAVTDQAGEIDFTVSSAALGAFDGIHNTRRAGPTSEVRLEATTLDSEWKQLGRPNVSTIKIDVEGAELLVLKGAQECIRTCQPFVLLEWNVLNCSACKFRAKDLLSSAKGFDYRVFSVPHLIPVDDETALAVQMLKTENFLLAPVVG